jgi:hypothetical protein
MFLLTFLVSATQGYEGIYFWVSNSNEENSTPRNNSIANVKISRWCPESVSCHQLPSEVNLVWVWKSLYCCEFDTLTINLALKWLYFLHCSMEAPGWHFHCQSHYPAGWSLFMPALIPLKDELLSLYIYIIFSSTSATQMHRNLSVAYQSSRDQIIL